MMKTAVKLSLLALIVGGGLVGMWSYYLTVSGQARIHQLEEEKRILGEVISRLGAERRVAEMLVTDQETVGGVKTSTVLLVEFGRDGNPLPPKRFVVRGENAHVDAMVVKFDDELVGKDDPLRGRSIALFTRIYGDATAPEQGDPIDKPGEIPAIYRGAGAKVTDFEMSLWRDFWKLAHDEAARKERGVRAVMGQGVWEPLRKNVLYTLTLENDGGLNIQREPVKGVFREALGG
jgi:hypothetical protein